MGRRRGVSGRCRVARKCGPKGAAGVSELTTFAMSDLATLVAEGLLQRPIPHAWRGP